jgi:hypothetical protein
MLIVMYYLMNTGYFYYQPLSEEDKARGVKEGAILEYEHPYLVKYFDMFIGEYKMIILFLCFLFQS